MAAFLLSLALIGGLAVPSDSEIRLDPVRCVDLPPLPFALCKRLLETPSGQVKKQKAKDPDIAALEDRLKRSMGTKVSIKHRGKAGKIEIEYYSLDELDRLLEILRA